MRENVLSALGYVTATIGSALRRLQCCGDETDVRRSGYRAPVLAPSSRARFDAVSSVQVLRCKLIRAQRSHRIEARGAARGHPAGKRGRADEQRGGGGERRGIGK